MICPEFALVSDSRRTRETFERVQDGLGVAVPHRFLRELYGASPRDILAATREASPTVLCLLIIGHNPGIADLVRESSRGGSDDALVAQAAHFSTACFAVISTDAPFADLGQGCRLERLFTADAGLRPP